MGMQHAWYSHETHMKRTSSTHFMITLYRIHGISMALQAGGLRPPE